MKLVRKVVATLLTAQAVAGGCGRSAGPMTISVMELTNEHAAFDGIGLRYNQLVSISGGLPIPEVGGLYYYQAEHSPSTAIGLGANDSYRLVGEFENPGGQAAVLDVRAKLERTVSLAARLAEVEAELDASQPVLAKAPPSDNIVRRSLEERFSQLAQDRIRLEADLRSAEDAYRVAANRPGIIVCRWEDRRDRSAGGSVGLSPGSSASGGVRSGNGASGFVILGGLRISLLFFGNDIYAMYAGLKPVEQEAVRRGAMTTYLLQARDIAYTAGLNTSAELWASVRLESAEVQDHLWRERLRGRLDYYSARLKDLANVGAVGNVTWTKERFWFTDFDDLRGLDLGRAPATFQGWSTVAAQLTSGRSIFYDYERYKHDLPPVTRHDEPVTLRPRGGVAAVPTD